MMKRSLKTMALLALTFALGMLPMKALAEEVETETQVETETDTQIAVLEEGENIRTGTMGDHNGIKWTYDESTRTLTVTGEDSGVYGIGGRSTFKAICEDAEIIIFQDCKLIGSAQYLLADLRDLKRIEFNNFDTSQVTDMGGMFSFCSNLTILDMSSFDTSQVTDMCGMFQKCDKLTNLDVTSFDTSQVTNMSDMFYGCSNLTSLDVSNLDTSLVTYMSAMFYECSNLTSLNLGNFNTSKVKSMLGMFQCCSKLKNLDISGFETSQVICMNYMFEECSSMTSLDLSSFDTSQVTGMGRMFYGCSSLVNLDLSSFETSQVTYMNDMLSRCSGLEKIRTPKNMADSQSIDLPHEFLDSNNNVVTAITKATCNMILKAKNLFADVERTKWYYPYVTYVVEKGLMSGTDITEDGKIVFKPEDSMTREQFVQVLYAKEGKPAVEYTAKFTDVPNGAWYTDAIMWATSQGVVAGKGDMFGVSELITREQMATMLFSYASYKGYDTSARAELTDFSDADLVSSWAVPSMQWAIANGIMKGTGNSIEPGSDASRAEAATMLKAFLDTFEK